MDDASATLLLVASTVAVFVASGVVPLVNAELSVIALGSVAPRPLLPMLLVVATLSHMAGKSLVYLAGRGAERCPIPALRRRAAAARGQVDPRTKFGTIVIFISAAAGVPPFYLVTVASGVLRYPLLHFFLVGFVGRLLRFGALLLLPDLADALGLLP
jgi:membrane protein YqaA with SNARE-associated domain